MSASKKHHHATRMESDIVIGGLLKDHRTRLGWTQEQLAEQLTEFTGVRHYQAHIARIESGRSPVPLVKFLQICELLGIIPTTILDSPEVAQGLQTHVHTMEG